MNAAPTAPDAFAPAPLGDEAHWELDTLKALGDLGLRLASASVAEAESRVAAAASESLGNAPDPTLAFQRISRAVRLTVMLHARIREGGLGQDRGSAADARAHKAEAALEDRRSTGRLRRSMVRFIAGTAIEALEREAPETERQFEALDERLDREGGDDAEFAELDVNDLAFSICRDLGVDPGPDWWEDGWGIASDPFPVSGRMGPAAQRREDGVTDLSEQPADARFKAAASP